MIRALDELPLKGLRAINQMEKKKIVWLSRSWQVRKYVFGPAVGIALSWKGIFGL